MKPNVPVAAAMIAMTACSALAQVAGGHRLGSRTGDRVTFPLNGVSMYAEALRPTVQRWYQPATLFSEYHGRQWEYTNYARSPYLRYQSSSQEGNYFYDGFGDLLTQGWIVYDWRQIQPRIAESSSILKSSQYVRWFDRQVIAMDSKGDYSFSIIVGDEINATLTPMTFRKAGFNGVMANLATRRARITGLFSRISSPVLVDDRVLNDQRTNYTNLVAGRAEVNLSPQMTIGVNFVNSHTTNGERDGLEGNPLKGNLATGQLREPVRSVLVRLSDDSPQDGKGGAVLIARDIEITTTLVRPSALDPSVLVERDTVIIGNVSGFDAVEIQGGTVKDGLLTADGSDSIVLRYVLSPTSGDSEAGSLRLLLQRPPFDLTLAEAEDAVAAISRVRFRMLLANDYRVEMSSDRQTNRFGVPQFRLVERADGNIKNQVNGSEVVFDYNLPTANLIYGLSAELRNVAGFDFYGEFNVNTQYGKYPAVGKGEHPAIAGTAEDESAIGWLANLAWSGGPWSASLEGFGMDDAYTTSVQPVNATGILDYSPESTNLLYDFVDDNDDDDRHPDQKRFNQGSLVPQELGDFVLDRAGVADPEVFPGYDENGDFISDFNQNHSSVRTNLLPDYDEPFLRYDSDRPQFLFGTDMNNNNWVDRFENDNLPDYPYKKDHWGYNGNAAVELMPKVTLTAGRLSEARRKTDDENLTTYGILTAERDLPGRGRLRLFNMLKLAADHIEDPLSQWTVSSPAFGDPGDDGGHFEAISDPLAAQSTWINTFYADWSYDSPRQWRTLHRFKWETWRQRDSDIEYVLDEAGNRVLVDTQGNPAVDGEPVVLFDPLGPEARNGRRASGFFGFIDKAEYRHYWGILTVSPKVKSEFLSEVPFARSLEKRRSWDTLLFLQVGFPALSSTRIEAGLEQRFFYDLAAGEDELVARRLSGDFRGTVLALQVTNPSQYLGYKLLTQIGMRYDRRSLEIVDAAREKRTSGLFFVSLFAGLD